MSTETTTREMVIMKPLDAGSSKMVERHYDRAELEILAKELMPGSPFFHVECPHANDGTICICHLDPCQWCLIPFKGDTELAEAVEARRNRYAPILGRFTGPATRPAL